MSRAIWTPVAQGELDDILFQVAVRDRRPITGERLYYEIRRFVDEYAQPNATRHIHPIAPPEWFYCRYKRWLVFYRLHADGIEVMRIIDGSRDLPLLLP